MHHYAQLPDPPAGVSAGAIMARFIDATGFRFHMATEGLTENEINFRPTEESMNTLELTRHIYSVLSWAHRSFQPTAKFDKTRTTFPELREGVLTTCAAFSAHLQQMSDEELAAVSVYLKRNDTTYSFWYLINGPISDALTHVGQIITWRRIAGNPIARISPFTGEGY